ncbi:cytochrome P450 [Corynespora cassiicola Philippines]|uniref:Cytochrome P450 n=1 Tax=Corynespora cassiicola Philippines TaxID=1448308 RepID=A0A2T2P4P1_CORCC|nr:cytochrome P450 [Corynespora cassiicola Philippines]
MLTRYPELTLDRWSRKSGPLYSVNLGNQLFIIDSDPTVAKDLKITNGVIFSDRKEIFIKNQTVLFGRGITVTPYNNRWRKHRRIAAFWLSQKAVGQYSNILGFENGAHTNPQTYAGRCSLNYMLAITFGFRTDSIHHPIVGQAFRLSREFMNLTSPMSNFTLYPAASSTSHRDAGARGRLNQNLVDIYGSLINAIDTCMKQGEQVADCLAKIMSEMQIHEGLDHLDMAILASDFMIRGVETISTLISTCPEIQKRAFNDEISFPYSCVIIKEVERYSNLFLFRTLYNPDRYVTDSTLSSASANLPDPNEQDHYMFGASQSICPGMLMDKFQISEKLINLNKYDGLGGRSPVLSEIELDPRSETIAGVLDYSGAFA